MKQKIHGTWYWHIIALFVLVFITTNAGSAAVASPDEMAMPEEEVAASPIKIEVDKTYATAYYWRGAFAGVGRANPDLFRTGFMQPSVDVTLDAKLFRVGANVWYSQGVEDVKDNSEMRYSGSLGVDVGPIGITAGATNYRGNSFLFTDSSVLEANVGVSINALPFDNGVVYYKNVSGDDDESAYVASNIGIRYKHLAIGVTAGIALGESELYGTEETALVDLTPSISYTMDGDAKTSISFNIGYNPNTDLRIPYITVGTSFSID